jgi:RNA polymerase sigma-70 factor (ECF subfamily)
MTDLRSEFEKIAIPFMDVLYNGALRLTRNAEGAGDLVQETFLRAYRSFAQFERGTNCKAWLFKILYSIFVNDYRKKQREPDVIQIDDIEKRFAGSEDGNNYTVVFHNNAKVIEDALNRLPEEFRMVVMLVDLEECTYEEAASIVNCPVGTVRSRLFRGRKILHLSLLEHAKSRGYLKSQNESER